MEAAPIQNGANRPADRRRHTLVPALLRVIVIAGFAVAGWIALAAFNQSASADERPARPDDVVQGRGIAQNPAFAFHGLASGGAREGGAGANAGVPPRSGAAWASRVAQVPDRLRELGHDPVGYLRTQGDEVLDRKDRAVRQMGELADAAGVPRVQITGVPSDTPITGGYVHDPVHEQPVPPAEEPRVRADERPAADETDRADEASGETEFTAVRDTLPRSAPAAPADEAASSPCADCQGDVHAPGPMLSSGQDNPRGGSGGHTFTPVADLQTVGSPAAPTAVETGTFHRTALADVAAPGGPSVVPD